MPYITKLPAALKARGLKVELVPGWETRGSASFNPRGAVAHWTAGAKTGDRGSLRVCVNGRPGLSGPLCNVFLTRAGVAVVVAAGRANHAGIPDGGSCKGLTGNSSVFGTEAENSGGGEWTAEQRWSYPRINAAYADLGAPILVGHNEWAPSRKIDIRDYTMNRMRAEVATLRAISNTNPPDPVVAELTNRETDMFILAQAERGVWLLGAGYAHHLNPEEWGQYNEHLVKPGKIPYVQLSPGGAGPAAFDRIRSVHTNNQA